MRDSDENGSKQCGRTKGAKRIRPHRAKITGPQSRTSTAKIKNPTPWQRALELMQQATSMRTDSSTSTAISPRGPRDPRRGPPDIPERRQTSPPLATAWQLIAVNVSERPNKEVRDRSKEKITQFSDGEPERSESPENLSARANPEPYEPRSTMQRKKGCRRKKGAQAQKN